ncbi:hypothetical protein P5673_015325 [Acropora cervicornis]|uniref:Uncharacterized protein n=1 Tax=Acropora cervicornis TaxID=6130 RepID=A0AAD9V5F9_ACRCE|nr:hypothetical protein P5673_015325 [Acropora cervicornis]
MELKYEVNKKPVLIIYTVYRIIRQHLQQIHENQSQGFEQWTINLAKYKSYDHDGCFVSCRLCRKFADLASDLEGKLCCDIVPWIPASCHEVSDLRGVHLKIFGSTCFIFTNPIIDQFNSAQICTTYEPDDDYEKNSLDFLGGKFTSAANQQQKSGTGEWLDNKSNTKITEHQTTKENVKPSSLKRLFPKRCQNQCISHHCHGRQGNDDDADCENSR